MSTDGNVPALLFHYREPVCRFNASQRRLLQVAITGATDTEIAAVLGTSVSVVKKRWSAIFERADACIADVIATAPACSDSSRGPQKRHKLLAWLRDRLEELRP